MALTSPEPVGVWWRGKVMREGDLIVPVERKSYNPFEYYFPAGVRTPKNESTRSLPYLFLKVDASDSGAILAFCERYGVLGECDLDGWKAYSGNITNILISTMEKPSQGAYDRLMADAWRKYIANLVAGLPPLPSALSRPMTTDQFHKAQRDLQETVDWMRTAEESSGSKANREARQKVELRFRAKLVMLRPYVAWSQEESGWVTGWDAGSLESLLYLMLLYDRQGRGHIKKCPWCKTVFMADRPKMRFCKTECGISFRVAKFREKNSGKTKLKRSK